LAGSEFNRNPLKWEDVFPGITEFYNFYMSGLRRIINTVKRVIAGICGFLLGGFFGLVFVGALLMDLVIYYDLSGELGARMTLVLVLLCAIFGAIYLMLKVKV
jgi:hypothetical protein